MDNANRVVLARVRLNKARNEYKGVEVNIDAGLYEIAITRAYYCVFHAMRAVLALDDVDFTKHSHVIGYINRYYVKIGKLEHDFGRIIKDASKLRNQSDYEDYFEAELDDAKESAEKAKRFLEAVEALIAGRLAGDNVQAEVYDEDCFGFDDDHEYDGDEDRETFDGGEDDEDEWER